jgi:hypothetical protein
MCFRCLGKSSQQACAVFKGRHISLAQRLVSILSRTRPSKYSASPAGTGLERKSISIAEKPAQRWHAGHPVSWSRSFWRPNQHSDLRCLIAGPDEDTQAAGMEIAGRPYGQRAAFSSGLMVGGNGCRRRPARRGRRSSRYFTPPHISLTNTPQEQQPLSDTAPEAVTRKRC